MYIHINGHMHVYFLEAVLLHILLMSLGPDGPMSAVSCSALIKEPMGFEGRPGRCGRHTSSYCIVHFRGATCTISCSRTSPELSCFDSMVAGPVCRQDVRCVTSK